MGINELWDILKPAQEVVNLRELATIEGYQRNPRGNRTLYIGVDIYAIMGQCNSAAQASVHGLSGIEILFFKLCLFLRYPIVWIFVFDGPSRPVKNGKAPLSHQPSWVEPVKQLVKLFGFHVHEAPGEGEAELSKMNSIGILDAIITTDSDALVLGARYILRSTPQSQSPTTHKEDFVAYDANTIEHDPELGLTRGALLLIALLMGGDYSNGVDKCGRVVAHALTHSGFGDTLLNAFLSMPEDQFCLFVEGRWIDSLRHELRTNSHGHLRSRRPQLASVLSASFASHTVIALSAWGLQLPDLEAISSFCSIQLGLAEPHLLLQTLSSNMWEGVFFQMLFSANCVYNLDTGLLSAGDLHALILTAYEKKRQTLRKWKIAPWYTVSISTTGFRKLAFPGLESAQLEVGSDAAEGEEATRKVAKTLQLWVPGCYLPQGLLDTFNFSSREGKRHKSGSHARSKPYSTQNLTASAGPSMTCIKIH
ncbi:unnamed protein product [Cyclocybe aegerita]|uniref:XPG-I domain-containing protein n=1 Tax=Cyclocybe aegerita TaxID=1973307 RepID=A0A8S0XMC1_CYCAE|nr:unnamed protein product [Cyclocybe aegerita]